MRVVIVHDWLTGLRGGEKVLELLLEIFPDATIATLLHVPGSTSSRIESRPIVTSFIQKLPLVERHYRWYLPLFPRAIESLDLSGFDLVLSSSHCAAKGAIARRGAPHICYCHTPMRYVWDRFEDYFGRGWKSRLLYAPGARRLRRWDRSSAKRVDSFVANSRYVASRIRDYYGREVDAVIPPPVDTDFYTPGSEGRRRSLLSCRLGPRSLQTHRSRRRSVPRPRRSGCWSSGPARRGRRSRPSLPRTSGSSAFCPTRS